MSAESLKPVRGIRGMAVTPHALASQSTLAILRDGGNAVEAMIAAAATIAVVYPHMNSIGGDGFWLISRPGQAPRGIEACGRAAGLAAPQWYRQAGPPGGPRRRGGGPEPGPARRDHGRRRGVGLAGRARARGRQAAALAIARGRDLLRTRGHAGHAEPGQLHGQVPRRAGAAARLRADLSA